MTKTGLLGVPHEYFHFSQHGQFLVNRFLPGNAQVDLNTYFDAIVRHRTTPNGLFGIKAHLNQAFPHFKSGFVTQYFGALKFVVIKRNDVLGQAISSVIADQTGKYTSHETAAAQPKYSSEAIESAANSLLAQQYFWDNFLRVNRFEAMTVYYESLVERPSNTLIEVCKFLGVDKEAANIETDLTNAGLERESNETNESWRQEYEKAFLV